MPFRFINRSCKASKLVLGGGACRLIVSMDQHVRWETCLRTAVAGKASWILAATLILANNMNSSTRLLVSRCCFCSTSIGSALSDESRWILSSADERDNAPSRIRPCFSLTAMVLSSRIEVVNGSLRVLDISVWLLICSKLTHLSSLRSWAAS